MKAINDPSMPGDHSERQVVVYQADWEDPLPGPVEEIKISIVNERAVGSKREREEDTVESPCAKRPHLAGFSCSTPLSARLRATQDSDLPAWHPPWQNPQEEELDDSLLELSDNEDDCELLLTVDQIETLLGEDDDDPCYAAEPSGKYNEETACVVTFTPSKSENEGENSGASPCKTLNASDTLVEESECEGDVSNYAAMPLSPCQSAIDPVEAIEQKQPSLCNVKPSESLIAETVMDRDLSTPLSDVKEVPAAQLPHSGSPLLLQPSTSLAEVDAALEWSEDSEFVFDLDIDNLLALSPGTAFSSEEDNDVGSAVITKQGSSCIISGSTLPAKSIESDQVSAANATCSTTSDAVQHHPLLSLNTAGLPKVHHHPSPAESEPPETSPIVPAEPRPSTKSSGTEQRVVRQKSSEAEESKGRLNAESTSRPTDPSPSTAPRANGNECKNGTSSDCKTQGSSDTEKQKPLIAVAALPRTSFRAFLSDFELENDKNIYCDQVLMHMDSQGQCNLEDPLFELASLLNQISRENQNWQHPSNFTRRNHPRFGKKPSELCTLKQWVANNGGPRERFKNIPSTFR